MITIKRFLSFPLSLAQQLESMDFVGNIATGNTLYDNHVNVDAAAMNNPNNNNQVELFSFDPVERLGLTTEQVEEARQQFGFNEISMEEPSRSIIFLKQFVTFFALILDILAIVSIVCDYYANFIIISVLLLLNARYGYLEHMHAESKKVTG